MEVFLCFSVVELDSHVWFPSQLDHSMDGPSHKYWLRLEAKAGSGLVLKNKSEMEEESIVKSPGPLSNSSPLCITTLCAFGE